MEFWSSSQSQSRQGRVGDDAGNGTEVAAQSRSRGMTEPKEREQGTSPVEEPEADDGGGREDERLGRGERVARGAALTNRDRQLVGYLAIARYLSTTQVRRLVYPGRTVQPCRRRLLRLAGLWKRSDSKPTKRGVHENFDPAYLRRRECRTFGGELVEVWALTEAGYLLAEQVLRAPQRTPRTDVGTEFLEHAVALNELLVGLVDPAARACSSCTRRGLRWRARGKGVYRLVCACGHEGAQTLPLAEELPFRWMTSESARLPWSEYDRRSGKAADRVISPDGVLELHGRRYFLECEMGTHSIVGGEGKPGATMAKVVRYERFIHGLADTAGSTTFYTRAFPDGLPAELLFLVPSEARRDHVRAALAGWGKEARRHLDVRALTFDEAPRQLLDGDAPITAGAGAASETTLRVTVTPAEVRALERFFGGVIAPLKRARAAARARRTAVPEYPAEANTVGELVRRLAAAISGTHREGTP